jgi:hypothetical protein
LICRRAFTDTSGKIFIVLHAERMDFDTGVYIENFVKNTTVENTKYRLIFMASKERSRNSYIVTAFDQHRSQVSVF